MGTKKNNLGVRIAMAVIGIALTAASVGLQKISGLGVDPFSVIIFGFSNAFHATYQTVYIVVCAVLLIIAFIFNRKLLGIATVVNLFFSGFVTDATRKAVVKMVGEHPSMAVRVILLLIVVIAWTLTRCSHTLPQLCQSFFYLFHHLCVFFQFSFFLIDLSLWRFADETFVAQHAVDTG